MKAVVTVGISASGKSTYAAELQKKGYVRIERDQIREVVHANKTGGEPFSWAKWKWKWEDEVTAAQNSLIESFAAEHDDVVVSDTNLHHGRRASLVTKLRTLGYDVEIKTFPIAFEDAVKRDEGRERSVGISVLAKQYEQWCEQFERRVDKTSFNFDKAIIVDVDGTLAEMHDRGPFEWDKVGNDKPKKIVIAAVNGLKAQGYQVIVMSGRDGSCLTQTAEWLVKHGVQFDEFFIRQEGDTRDDRIIKEELFREHVEPHYNVECVIDDRPKVCTMWRKLGLEVLQVGNPYIQF